MQIPVWQKYSLTIDEAAEYTGVGKHRLRELVKANDSIVIYVGKKVLLKRNKLEKYLDDCSVL